jgi:heat-inducible transcriptional repressor
VPTDAGYRLYVGEMLRPRAVRPEERRRIQRGIAAPATSVEDALREACVALAQLTGYPAVATLPGAARDTFRQVQINALPPRRLILVLVTASGRVEHRLFEIDDVSAQHLATVVNFLNQQLAGRTLSSLRTLTFEEFSAGLHGAEIVTLARRAFEWVQNSIPESGGERIVVQGLVTLLDEPEFSEIHHARAAMQLFQDEAAVADILLAPLEEYGRNRMQTAIVVGREYGRAADSARFSLVGVAYGAGDETLGAVGVLGPTRMKYADAAALLPLLAARLQSSIESI